MPRPSLFGEQMLRLLLAFAIWQPALAGGAPVTVAEAMATCEAALAQGFAGEEAARCEWYARPCGVCGVDAPRSWCIPEGLPAARVVRTVLDDWRAEEGSEPAIPAAERALARHYPCPVTP